MKILRIPSMIFRLRSFLPILLFLFFINHIQGQEDKDESVAAIALTKMNVVYLGVDNPVKIAVSGYDSSELEVYTEDNGTIKGSNGNYTIKPQQPGDLTVAIKVNNQIINRTKFRVKRVPDPTPVVIIKTESGAKIIKGGQISKADLLKLDKVESQMLNFEFDLSFKVTEFTMIINNGEVEKEMVVKSEYFSSEQKEILNSLSKGDEICLNNILAMGPNGANRRLDKIKLTVSGQ